MRLSQVFSMFVSSIAKRKEKKKKVIKMPHHSHFLYSHSNNVPAAYCQHLLNET